jgi:hypothetical protein
MEAVPTLPILLLVVCGAGILGLGAIAGLIVLLLKLGVIGQYALKQEPEEIDAEYSLSQSREARYEEEPEEEPSNSSLS